MTTNLEQFINKYKNNWKDILTKPPYNITIKEDEGFTLLKYNQFAEDTNWYDPIVQECRGIILDKNNKVVCHAFNRFYNLGEPYAASIDWTSISITEKMDGSIIKIWADNNGKVHISTNNVIDAFKVPLVSLYGTQEGLSFGELVVNILGKDWETIKHNVLCFRDTMIFELISPYNKVVMDYGEEPSLYYLGSRNESGREFYDHWFFDYLNRNTNIKEVKAYDTNNLKSAEDVKNLVEKLEGHEGVVVKDRCGNRVKVKNISYVLKHKFISNLTKKDIIEAILQNEVEELLASVSNETYKTHILEIKEKMKSFKEEIENTVAKEKNLTLKEFATKYKEHKSFSFLISAFRNNGVLNYNKFNMSLLLKFF